MYAFYVFGFVVNFEIIVAWHKETSRRNFFEKYASQHGFDPNRAANWYQQSSAHIKAIKVCFLKFVSLFSFSVFFFFFRLPQFRAQTWYCTTTIIVYQKHLWIYSLILG